MLSFRRSKTSAPAFVSLTLAAAIMSACAMPANNGFVQSRPDARPFAEANSRCWEDAMGSNVGGSSQFGGQMSRYENCMDRAGWSRPKSM
jgi:hypothetical protein